MQFLGIIIGIATFCIIGLFHPLVIKAEYFFGVKVWPAFLIMGLGFCALSLFIENVIISSVLGVAGFSSFWSILEIFDQRERVKKGWFPSNPKRMAREEQKADQ